MFVLLGRQASNNPPVINLQYEMSGEVAEIVEFVGHRTVFYCD